MTPLPPGPSSPSRRTSAAPRNSRTCSRRSGRSLARDTGKTRPSTVWCWSRLRQRVRRPAPPEPVSRAPPLRRRSPACPTGAGSRRRASPSARTREISRHAKSVGHFAGTLYYLSVNAPPVPSCSDRSRRPRPQSPDDASPGTLAAPRRLRGSGDGRDALPRLALPRTNPLGPKKERVWLSKNSRRARLRVRVVARESNNKRRSPICRSWSSNARRGCRGPHGASGLGAALLRDGREASLLARVTGLNVETLSKLEGRPHRGGRADALVAGPRGAPGHSLPAAERVVASVARNVPQAHGRAGAPREPRRRTRRRRLEAAPPPRGDGCPERTRRGVGLDIRGSSVRARRRVPARARLNAGWRRAHRVDHRAGGSRRRGQDAVLPHARRGRRGAQALGRLDAASCCDTEQVLRAAPRRCHERVSLRGRRIERRRSATRREGGRARVDREDPGPDPVHASETLQRLSGRRGAVDHAVRCSSSTRSRAGARGVRRGARPDRAPPGCSGRSPACSSGGRSACTWRRS